MAKNKKIILGVLLLLFLLIIIIVIVLNSEDEIVEKPNNISQEQDRFELVVDYEEFFDVQATINDVGNLEMDASYTAKEIYINSISSTYYYFIKCCKFEEFNYYPEKYLLLILNKKNNTYELIEITEPIQNLEEYAKNYNVESVNVNLSNKFLNGNYTIKNLLIVYLEYFKSLLIKDPYTAFNMLSDETKSKYIDYNDFETKSINIYDMLSTEIFSFSLQDNQEGENKVYYFEDNNRNKIVIYEESIMDFKISY